MDNQTEGWINLGQAATHLQVSKSFLYQKGEELGIPRARLGSKYRYKKSELDTWLQSNKFE
jgi:excisionase family DNA binding protein